MATPLTAKRIKDLKPKIDPDTGKPKPNDLFDGGGGNAVKGLLVRAQPGGNKFYYVQYRRRSYVNKRKTKEVILETNSTRLRLGSVDHIDLREARRKAGKVVNDAKDAVSAGYFGEGVRQYVLKKLLNLDKTPAEIRQEQEDKHHCPTVEEFIDYHYAQSKQQMKSFADGREIHRLKYLLTVLSKKSKQGRKGNPKFDLLGKKLYDIDSNLIQDWVTERLCHDSERTGRPPSKVTVMREVNMIRALFAAAVSRGHVDTNPATGNHVNASPKRSVNPLNADEEDRLIKALLDREDQMCADGEAEFPVGTFKDLLRPIVLLAMHTGMRFGELTSLRWSNVHFTNIKTGEGRNYIELPETKGGETLEMPLNRFAVDVLRAWFKQRATIYPDAYVFPDKNGNRLRDIRRYWKPVFEKAGLPKGYRFHDLRHHFASKLAMSGVPLYALQKLLNHSSPKMTQRYAKFSPNWMDQTVGLLDKDQKWTL
jgi:integrase